MAIDKDPSIYRDRGTIGSSDELDEYGVWVKSEPQVLRDDSAGVAQSIEPALPDIEDLPDLDLDMTEELPSSAQEHMPIEPAEELVPDFTDLPTFSMEEETEQIEADTEIESGEPIEPLSEDAFTELSMDDFLESSEETQKTESLSPQNETVEEEFQDIDLDFSAEDEAAVLPETPEPTDSKDSIALESVSDFDDFLNELSDQSSPTPPPVAAEALDGMPELNIDLDINEEKEPNQAMNNEEISVDLSSSDGIPEMEVQFDDVGAVGKALQDEQPRAPKTDLSTELLMRIADELSSMKNELVNELASLKGELSVLRSAAKQEAAPAAETHEAQHGFFDEEDDEKIALTGDELDNILNTADFTEEAGSDAGEEMEGGEANVDMSLDFLSDKPDILGDEEEPAAESAQAPTDEEIAISEEIEIADEASADEPSIESIELEDDLAAEAEPIELASLRESGVTPMTPAPEDTSYLEQEEVDIAPIGNSDSIDLTEAVIEEPDLSGFSIEEPVIEEPSIDSIDIDLDLEEPLHVEEIVLPVETKEESFAEVLPEGFVVESESDSAAIAEQEEIPEEIEEELEIEEVASDSLTQSENGAEAAFEPVAAETGADSAAALPQNLRQEVRAVLSYMDQLLESLPESKIEEFAKSDYFDTYKKLFEELGIA